MLPCLFVFFFSKIVFECLLEVWENNFLAPAYINSNFKFLRQWNQVHLTSSSIFWNLGDWYLPVFKHLIFVILYSIYLRLLGCLWTVACICIWNLTEVLQCSHAFLKILYIHLFWQPIYVCKSRDEDIMIYKFIQPI